MSLINLLPKSNLGLKGALPVFQVLPVPPGSLHDTYSINGTPKVSILSINAKNPVPRPSRLDEQDTSNTNKFQSQIGKRYLDNPPK